MVCHSSWIVVLADFNVIHVASHQVANDRASVVVLSLTCSPRVGPALSFWPGSSVSVGRFDLGPSFGRLVGSADSL